ncbi:MAG: hypothetical protein Q7Q73_15680 [Verrucomicrobiota bacterium JB024]|nr:hypothetical protein [Verrucomicrobiota bacterium JB024]
MKVIPNTRLIIPAIALFTLSATAVHSQTLLVHYNLNDGPAGTSVTTINDSGSNGVDLTGQGLTWSAEGEGVGGTGISLYDGAATVQYGIRGYNTSTGSVFDGMTSYTVTGWINMHASQNGGRLLSISNGDGSDQMQIYLNNDYLRVQNNLGGVASRKDSGTYNMLNQGWVYFAMTIDSTQSTFEDAVKFYFGSETVAATYLGNASGSVGTIAGLAMGDTSTIVLGNSYNAGTAANNRAIIDSNLYDLRIYGSSSGSSGALSAAEVENIRQTAIPESSSISLVLGIASVGLLSLRLFRRNADK